MSTFNVKERKKQLITDEILKNPELSKGRNTSAVAVVLIFILEIIDLVVMAIFASMSKTSVSIWQIVILFISMFILYMIYDGNKALIYLVIIGAVVSIFNFFSSVYPILNIMDIGQMVCSVIAIATAVLQFLAAVTMLAIGKCDKYFNAMQKINNRIRLEMMSNKH